VEYSFAKIFQVKNGLIGNIMGHFELLALQNVYKPTSDININIHLAGGYQPPPEPFRKHPCTYWYQTGLRNKPWRNQTEEAWTVIARVISFNLMDKAINWR